MRRGVGDFPLLFFKFFREREMQRKCGDANAFPSLSLTPSDAALILGSGQVTPLGNGSVPSIHVSGGNVIGLNSAV